MFLVLEFFFHIFLVCILLPFMYSYLFKNNYKRQTILLVSQGLKLTLCATEATLVVIFGKKEKRKKGRSKKKGKTKKEEESEKQKKKRKHE